MGMAASQARYLALVARKSNCEYEGQQINQQRLTLSNQSANLFNQMLGLSVPVPPSTSDYTKVQYSYSDGTNASTISSWQQLGTADPDYNYVVTHYYYTDKYTGSLKKLSDPQVQFENDNSKTTPTTAQDTRIALDSVYKAAAKYQADLADEETKKAALESATTAYDAAKKKAGNKSTYAVPYSNITVSESGGTYTVTDGTNSYDFEPYSSNTEVKNQIDTLIANGAITASDAGDVDPSTGETDYSHIYVYKDANNNYQFAFEQDLNNCLAGTTTALTAYDIGEYDATTDTWSGYVVDDNAALTKAYNDYTNAKTAYTAAQTQSAADKLNYETAVATYESTYNSPSYIGNCKVTRLDSLTSDQAAELEQVMKDMEEQGIDCNMSKCFTKNADGTYTYDGGVYSFTMNGTTYYTTIEDLYSSYQSGTGNNNIDGQQKLAYYNASYISTKVEKTEKALMETDGNGRFTSIRFENDSVTYTLNAETITDENAYNDAMNQYNYETAVYDKTVQDINAKTSIIQQEDQELELRLKQLDTEQNALSTEMDAVQKVVKDNIEKSFKTFNG